MKITLTDGIVDYEGDPVTDGTSGDKEKQLDIRTVFGVSLNNTAEGEVLTPEQKLRMFHLSQRLFGSDVLDLTVEDAAFIKERVGLFYVPLVYGRIVELLDGKDK